MGFIQIKLTEFHRLHVYCPEVSVTVDEEDVHDHRYGFKSEILKGELTNKVFSVDFSGNTHLIKTESCNPDKPVTEVASVACGLKEMCKFTTKQGSFYLLNKDTSHRVETVRAITFLTREEPSKDAATVIYTKNKPTTCPFSVNMADDELWRLVERELNDTY